MNELKITASDLKVIVDDLRNKICHNHMSNITIINSCDLFMTFSNYRKEKLLISLNPHHPFISFVDIKDPCGTKVGMLSDLLRKEVKDGYILDVQTINNDRIISIEYIHTNDYYDKEKRKLILELIPLRPNLIICDENDKVLYALHSSDISSQRPIAKGMIYRLPEKNGAIVEQKFDYARFMESASKYYQEAKHKRLEEQFKPVLQHIKSRIKTLKQKIKVLNQEIEDANNALQSQEIGNMILTYAYSEEELKKYIEENNINYDFSLTAGANAQKYFHKYKKAKRTIEMDNIELEKTEDEINYLQTCFAQSKYMNEDEIIELANLLFPNKFKINPKQKLVSKPGEIIVNDIKILFGKNAKQNDMLTFKKSNKDDIFFHVKDYHGSHVVIAHPSPDNDTILTACEIALLLSGKEVGDVQSCKIKNVKKGSFMGQAILTSYQTYTINSIRAKTKDLLR